MQAFRHHLASPDEIETLRLANSSSGARGEQKLMRKVDEEKKARLNSERRERRMKKKLGELQLENEGLEAAVQVIEGENETLHQEAEESVRQRIELREEVRHLTAKFNSRVRREPQKTETAVKRALSSVFAGQQTVYKVKTPDGIIQNWARDVILHLICASDVPAANTWVAFSCVASGLGVPVEGSWSARSAGRVVLEGALAVEEMIVEDFQQALGKVSVSSMFAQCLIFPPAFTLSGDGATHKIIPHTSRWAVMIPHEGLKPKDRFLGITPELNHTAATQVKGFKEEIQRYCDDYNASPLGTKHHFDSREIWRKMTGYLSDHAADQKEVFQELATYHQECDLELLGEAAVFQQGPDMEQEIEAVLDEKGAEVFKDVGGAGCWKELPEEERLRLGKKMVRDAEICLGERVLERLPEDQKNDALRGCFWSGCGMHKDLNAVKEGTDRMSKWWGEAGKVPPVALTNKIKAETAAGLGGEVPVCRSDRGGVKLTNLIGALVKHKDSKKGQQDRFRTFSRNAVGVEVYFPDTSNTRYQAHTYAAAEIINHRELYLNFLTFLATTKTSTPDKLNHMEENIRRGITDGPTITELIVLSLYGEAVSAPFAQFLRSSEEKNGLDLGPDYTRFKKHIQNLIDNPNLLIGPNIDATKCSLNGQPWGHIDVIHTIEEIYPNYPDLEGALVAFLRGALEKLETFTKEFEEGSPLSKATPEERWLAFRRPTNDRNEGALGLLRRMYRRFSNIRFGQLNARLMSK